jgi:hypothetical protein
MCGALSQLTVLGFVSLLFLSDAKNGHKSEGIIDSGRCSTNVLISLSTVSLLPVVMLGTKVLITLKEHHPDR